jgi:hypothetical protein
MTSTSSAAIDLQVFDTSAALTGAPAEAPERHVVQQLDDTVQGVDFIGAVLAGCAWLVIYGTAVVHAFGKHTSY